MVAGGSGFVVIGRDGSVNPYIIINTNNLNIT